MLSWGREQVMIMDDDNWKLYLLNPQVLPLPLPLPLLRHRTEHVQTSACVSSASHARSHIRVPP